MMPNKNEIDAASNIERVGTAIVFLLLPSILLVAHAYILISPIGTIDPWLYLGYKLDLVGHLKAFPGYYYGSRLPALLPGSLLHSVLPPLAANYVDHLLFYCISIVSLFFVVKSCAGVRSGLIAVILMGYYCFFLQAVGWDYIDGAGNTYLLSTLAFVTYSMKSSRPRTLLLLAGASFGLAVFTNLFLAIFAPVFALFFWSAKKRESIKKFVVELIFVSSGFVIVTLALCLVNFIMVGDFLFFGPSLVFVKNSVGFLKENPWRIPGALWLLEARHLMLPMFVFVGSVLFLIRHLMKGNGEVTTGRVSLELAFVAVGAIMILCQFLGMNVLQIYYYSSYVIPFMFPVIGIWSRPFVVKLTTRQFALVAIFMMILMTLSLSSEMVRRTNQLGELQVFWSIALFFVVLVTLLVLRKRLVGLLLSICALALAYSSLSSFGSELGSPIPHTKGRDSFLAVVKGVQLVKEADPKYGIRFWYDANESFGPVYRGISSAYLWGPRLVNESYPDLRDVFDPSRQVQLGARTKVLILSEKEKSVQDVNRALGPLSLTAKAVKRDSVCLANINFKTLLIETIISDVSSEVKERFKSATVLYDISDDNLFSTLQRNCYGNSDPEKVLPKAGTRFVYCPKDYRDHLATRFVDVRQPTPGKQSWIQFGVSPSESLHTSQSCTLTLQDDSFRELFSIPYAAEKDSTGTNGPLQWYVRMPEKTVKVRVRITAPPNSESIIPRSLTLKQAIF